MSLLTNPGVANDPQTGEPWSNREIARRCHVGDRLVREVRAEVDTASGRSMNIERTFTHHKTGKPTTMNTARARVELLEALDDLNHGSKHGPRARGATPFQ